MSGCPGCLLSEIEYQEQLTKIQKEAKAYAISHHKVVVIYLNPDRSPGYITYEAAKAGGYYILQYISPLQPLTDG